MSRIIIRNVGPIESLDIELNKVNVFIGPQGSGKSTVAKIVSFCSWLEKVNDSTSRAVADGLVRRLSVFHHMDGYFSSESEILYEGENVAFAYNWNSEPIPFSKTYSGGSESLNEGELLFYSAEKTVNPKVAYIPAERNFVSAVPSLRNYSDRNDNLQSFVNDWFDAKRHYTLESPAPVMGLGLDYFYNKGLDMDCLLIERGNRQVPLDSASSGFQSVVPLVVLLKWLSSGIYEENKPFSPAENEKVRNILNHISESSDGKDSELIERLRGFIQGRVYSHTQFIVEEPEQNLFPKTQMELLYSLLSEINHGRNHRLVLTTHSPYILYALNNCILAHNVKSEIDNELSSKISCMPYALDPNCVSVWSIDSGYLRGCNDERNSTIQDEHGLIRKNYFNDVMKDIMSDFNAMLPFLD